MKALCQPIDIERINKVSKVPTFRQVNGDVILYRDGQQYYIVGSYKTLSNNIARKRYITLLDDSDIEIKLYPISNKNNIFIDEYNNIVWIFYHKLWYKLNDLLPLYKRRIKRSFECRNTKE